METTVLKAQRYRTSHGERRLAAVLSADMVDYSRFMGANEEWTLTRLRSLRRDLIDPEIRQHGGRVVKSTGDGILAEFTSVVEAVGCAVEIQRGMGAWNGDVPETRRIALRIGINVGELVVERDGDIYGDSVNVAARLEAIAPPGGLCLSLAAYEQVRGRLPYPIEEWGERPLKNIERPVLVFAIGPDVITQLPDPGERDARPAPEMRFVSRAAVWLAVLLLASAGGFGIFRLLERPASNFAGSDPASSPGSRPAGLVPTGSTRPLPQESAAARLSIVVLPFANLDGGAEYETLTESIAADITSELSRIEGSFVIAAGTALAQKGRRADPRDLGRDLNVRYVLHGSLRHTDDRIRLNVRLTDTRTGAEIWADRFTSQTSSLAQAEEELVAQLARALNVELTEADLRRFREEKQSDRDPGYLAARGWSVLNRPLSRESLLGAREDFEQALARDAQSVQARVGLARSLALTTSFGWSASATSDLARAEQLIDAVLTARPGEAMAYCVKGEILRGRRQYEAAIAAHQAAITHNANLAPAYGSMANAALRLGRVEEAYTLAERAVRLSPQDPLLGLWSSTLCEAAARRERHDEAITWCSRSLVAPSPQPTISYVNLASAYVAKGQLEEAKRVVAQLDAIRPGYTIRRWREESHSMHTDALRDGDLLSGRLREAGLPE